MQKNPTQCKTQYIPISVRADFLASGQIIPLRYIDETGKRIDIDRVNREETHYGNKYFTCVTYKEICKPDENETDSIIPAIVSHTVPTVSVI